MGKVCERQCSTDGRSCVPVEELQAEVEECAGAFAFAKTTHVCVPPVSTGPQVITLRDKLVREKSRWRPIDPSNPAADSPECMLAQEILACFSVFRECAPGTDVELPLCLETCKSYGRNCGVELSDGLCTDPAFRDTRDSALCSGSANPKDYLTRAQKFGIIFGAIIAFMLILLLILLWLFRCGPCSRREVPPIPPRMRELTDDGDDEEAAEGSMGSSRGLQMGAVQVQEPPPLCGLSRRRWHGSGRFAQPGAAAAVRCCPLLCTTQLIGNRPATLPTASTCAWSADFAPYLLCSFAFDVWLTDPSAWQPCHAVHVIAVTAVGANGQAKQFPGTLISQPGKGSFGMHTIGMSRPPTSMMYGLNS